MRAIILAVLFFFNTLALAYDPPQDLLKGAELLAVGTCVDEGMEFKCAALKKGEQLLLAMADEDGVYRIYTVKKFKPRYATGEMVVLWERPNT